MTFATPEGKEVYRHSSTHIMAQAVKEVFPSAQLTIGPALEESFYYDFAFDRPFTPEDLEKIEARAQEIIKAESSLSAKRNVARRRHEDSSRSGRGVQGRDHRRVHGSDGVTLRTGNRLRRSVSRTARAEHGTRRRIQVALDRRRLLAWRRAECHAAARSTARRFPPRRSWTPILPNWRKSSGGITGSSEKSSI